MAETQTELTMDAVATTAKTPRGRAPGTNRSEKSRGPSRPKSELELLAEISTKLDRVVAVLAAQGKDRNTQVAILASANCNSDFIGTVVGLTAGAVRKLPGWRRGQGGDTADASEGSR